MKKSILQKAIELWLFPRDVYRTPGKASGGAITT